MTYILIASSLASFYRWNALDPGCGPHCGYVQLRCPHRLYVSVPAVKPHSLADQGLVTRHLAQKDRALPTVSSALSNFFLFAGGRRHGSSGRALVGIFRETIADVWRKPHEKWLLLCCLQYLHPPRNPQHQ